MKMLIFPAGTTAACAFAARCLQENNVTLIDHPSPEITHVLLDVPSFGADEKLRGGGNAEAILERIPENVTVIGGGLEHPALEGYEKIDLLKDAVYLAENAAITADCALGVARKIMTGTFRDFPVLVLGWGRIGKCLARNLQNLGVSVAVAARKESDRAMLSALGYIALDYGELPQQLGKFRMVYNTVPASMVSRKDLGDCLVIDLASGSGLAGENVILARGLPGTWAPESSGRLIAARVLALCREGKV